MENENVVLCPVHKEPLKLKMTIMELLGEKHKLEIGECSRCRCIYTGMIVKGIPRFTHEGKQYQYLNEIEEREDERKRRKEEEQKKQDRIKLFPFLESKSFFVKVIPDKRNYGELNREESESLTVILGKGGKNIIDGDYCAQDNTLYLNQKFCDVVECYIRVHGETKKLGFKVYNKVFTKAEIIEATSILFLDEDGATYCSAEELQKQREHRQKIHQQEELQRQQEKLETEMPTTVYVVENIARYSCPACKRKASWMARTLVHPWENGELKKITLVGMACLHCQRVFISRKVAGCDFLERYAERIDFKYFQGIEEKGGIGGENAECNEATKITSEIEKEYPCLKNRQIAVRVCKTVNNKCPSHEVVMEQHIWSLSRSKGELEMLLQGRYCPKCNILYITSQNKATLDEFYEKYGAKRIPFKLLPAKLRTAGIKPAKVTDIRLLKMAEDHSKYVQNKSVEILEDEVRHFFDREILVASALVDRKEKMIRILTLVTGKDERECAPDELLIREAESTGRELLGRIAHDQLGEFSSKYGTIKIHDYKVWSGQEHHLDGFTRFCDPENIQNITIMRQNNISRDSDEYEMVTALVYCANRVEPVYIDVYYSKQQNKYFINEESYRQYRMRYGLPYVHLVADEYDGDMDYGNLRKNSELNLYGYTVAKAAEMTTGERQRLLQQLMDNGLMSKHQIVNHLEWLIHRQSGRIKMEDACDCWKEDLRFVNNYRISTQRKIQGRFVYGKTVLR